MDIDLLDSSTQDPDFFLSRCYGFHARVLYFIVVGVKELLPPPVALR